MAELAESTYGTSGEVTWQVLRILSYAAAKPSRGVETPLTKPLETREVSDE